MTGVCRVCGCTDTTPCTLTTEQNEASVDFMPCWWVDSELRDLCSGCELEGEDAPESPLLYDAWGRPIDFGGSA